ncbi:Eukaryotic translation initiation factor 3 30 kDa subunit [Caenorhabditis elegans]|uniref:Eukaryotic translation initiation factor 3 30 kDa subunit n=1 Tax=Caenorhabditis elegans TaxID=6239 RepID=U4PLJ0_CAEEL|nr:Eukaryotic translation initiation factor 3 30 kDa subunit [Caenorhabditis elegans]CDH92972.1 Eukaryotic translation initiation factor 3 30 kDa subunit [Caenorhabditis elegans]|eukprot:NP_001294277.1 Uncharacterized protein CELE_T04C4.3 [Caenorhabditis elegans]
MVRNADCVVSSRKKDKKKGEDGYEDAEGNSDSDDDFLFG